MLFGGHQVKVHTHQTSYNTGTNSNITKTRSRKHLADWAVLTLGHPPLKWPLSGINKVQHCVLSVTLTIAPGWQMPAMWGKKQKWQKVYWLKVPYFFGRSKLPVAELHVNFRFWWNAAVDTCNWKVKSNGNGANRKQNLSTGSSNSWYVGLSCLPVVYLLDRNNIFFAIIYH